MARLIHMTRRITPGYRVFIVEDEFILEDSMRPRKNLVCRQLARSLSFVQPVPEVLSYNIPYSKKPSGQIIWKTAQAPVIGGFN